MALICTNFSRARRLGVVFGRRLRDPKGFMLKPDYKRKEQTIAHYATAAA
jgi:hypothetical protein